MTKPYNGGQWTEARLRSFIMSALRGARWPQKWEASKRAYVRRGTNPATGKPCKLHKCEQCGTLVPKGGIQADHINPVVPTNGKWGNKTRFLGYNWNEVMERLFVEADGFGAICKVCHKERTDEQRKERINAKKKARSKMAS